MKIVKDYEELLELLNKHKVKYCIVGAFAVGLYGYPRYTKDIDVFAEPTPLNAQKILKALREFGFESLNLKEKDFINKNSIIQLGYEPVRIDIITSIPGIRFSQAWKNRKTVTYGKTPVYFIGKNDLIRSKKATGRKIDQADLENL